jgi:hypothetical protein
VEQSERDDVTDERFRSIRETLEELKADLKVLRSSVEDGGRWRAGTEAVLDSMIERIDQLEEKSEKLEEKQNLFQKFIDQFVGGKAAVMQLIATMISALGVLAVLIKMAFSK